MPNQPVTHLRISRAIWLRGEGGSSSFLLRCGDAKMCCLGIYLEACGISRRILQGVGSPILLSIRHKIPAEVRWLFTDDGRESQDCAGLMSINDRDLTYSNHFDEDQRERSIIRRFSQQGITVEFTE